MHTPTINYALKSKVAILHSICSYAPLICTALHSIRNFIAMNPENADKSMTKPVKTLPCYCKSTPCIVSEKNWNTKGTKVSPLYVGTEIGENAYPGMR